MKYSDIPTESMSIEEYSQNGYFLQLTGGRKLSAKYHTHQFYEILLVLRGSCQQILDGIEVACETGNIFVLSPGQAHSFIQQTDGTEILALSVETEEMERFLTAYDLRLSTKVRQFAAADCVYLEHRCRELLLLGIKDVSAFRVLLGHIIGLLLETGLQGQQSVPEQFRVLLSRMQSSENIAGGVQQFVKLSNFSYSHLSRLTEQYLGITPGQYCLRLRLKLAHELIVWSEMPYEEICTTVGFSSFSHFCKVIHTEFDATPAALRHSAKENTRTI